MKNFGPKKSYLLLKLYLLSKVKLNKREIRQESSPIKFHKTMLSNFMIIRLVNKELNLVHPLSFYLLMKNLLLMYYLVVIQKEKAKLKLYPFN